MPYRRVGLNCGPHRALFWNRKLAGPGMNCRFTPAAGASVRAALVNRDPEAPKPQPDNVPRRVLSAPRASATLELYALRVSAPLQVNPSTLSSRVSLARPKKSHFARRLSSFEGRASSARFALT